MATDIDVVTNALDRDWLALRQWARRTWADAQAHAEACPEVAGPLRELGPPLTRLITACAWHELPLPQRLATLEERVQAHIAEDQANG